MAPSAMHADVERLDGDRVNLRWRWHGPPEDGSVVVEVALDGPDGVAVQHHVVDGGAASIELTSVAEHPRPWFRIRAGSGMAIVLAERRLPVDGTLNFRDLGGYPTAGGRRTRWGQVFRSDNFADVGPEAWRRLREMGLREVFDLRHDAERERQPTTIPDDLDLVVSVLAIGGEAAEAADLVGLLTSSGGQGFGLDYMITMYAELIEHHSTVFATLLGHLADPARRPAVFHCTAGKDRTGVAAALLLSVLGVDRETVLDDYELTTQYRSARRIEVLRPLLEAAGVDVEAVRPFLSAPRAALATALARVDAEHGSVTGFLATSGLAHTAPAQLRAQLLE